MKVLRVEFQNEIRRWEIPLFRGAVLAAMGDDMDILFHNHSEEGFRYAYPLIQYKRIHGKAAMVCVGAGAEAVEKFFAGMKGGRLELNFGERKVDLQFNSAKVNDTPIQLWPENFTYHLRQWLSLNQDNYQEYITIEGVADQCLFLENILTANMLAFLKGIDIHLEQNLTCKITQMDKPFLVKFKGVKMMCFDVEFKSNLSLPDYIGLGKGVSLGFGTVTQKRVPEN